MSIPDRLKSLRKAMRAQRIDAYIIPSSDPHQSEYVADRWKGREWISGFDGSAGTVIVLADQAGLWTDSRYFLQAETQLAGTGFDLHRQGVPHAPEHLDWLLGELAPADRVGLDGRLFSIAQIRSLERRLEDKGIVLVTNLDLLDPIWENRPDLPATPIYEHPVHYAGKSRQEKFELVRAAMRSRQVDYYLIAALDDLAWLFNLRGSDIEYNPVFYAYALIEADWATLFVPTGKLTPELTTQLQDEGIAVRPYAAIALHLDTLPKKTAVLIDPWGLNAQVFSTLQYSRIVEAPSPIRMLKAIKTKEETAHIRQAMVADGLALLHLYRWLETTLRERSVPETEVAEKLRAFRGEQGNYFGESFAAIVGYQSNGAIVHYRPKPGACASIEATGLLLLDSGGQYLNGTTDITRTTALAPPKRHQKRHFTLVLKGHIALARAVFPAGTTGMQLDVLARQFLWAEELDYGHGTGHGVGYFLNVHESPQGFAASTATSRGTTALQAGMLTSNEPGYYEEGAYGIRIENLILCVEANLKGFLKFETLTLFPIDTTLIEPALLSELEKEWLNQYHALVEKKLSPHLDGEDLAWLQERCKAI